MSSSTIAPAQRQPVWRLAGLASVAAFSRSFSAFSRSTSAASSASSCIAMPETSASEAIAPSPFKVRRGGRTCDTRSHARIEIPYVGSHSEAYRYLTRLVTLLPGPGADDS